MLATFIYDYSVSKIILKIGYDLEKLAVAYIHWHVFINYSADTDYLICIPVIL